MEGPADTRIFSGSLWRFTASVLGACAQVLCSSCAAGVMWEALGPSFWSYLHLQICKGELKGGNASCGRVEGGVII